MEEKREKVILIVGEGEPHGKGWLNCTSVVDGEVCVKYFRTAQLEAMPERICGYQPDVIINLSKPSDEVLQIQQLRAALRGQIINLYDE